MEALVTETSSIPACLTLFLSSDAPIALEPIPASQANTMDFTWPNSGVASPSVFSSSVFPSSVFPSSVFPSSVRVPATLRHGYVGEDATRSWRRDEARVEDGGRKDAARPAGDGREDQGWLHQDVGEVDLVYAAEELDHRGPRRRAPGEAASEDA